MYTKQQRLSIYFTAYCCLDGEECILTQYGLCKLLSEIADSGMPYYNMKGLFPELYARRPKGFGEYGFPLGYPVWPKRKEILRKAMEVICKNTECLK